MQAFNYVRPATLADASAYLQAADADAKLLAGGQSLLGAMKLGLAAPTALIDLQAVSALQGIALGADSNINTNTLRIGAMATHHAIAHSAVVQAFCPMLAQLAGQIADAQVRQRGTIGGSVANNDPAACWPAAVLALNARIVTHLRSIAADDFFTDLYTTALQASEIITHFEFESPARAAYVKFKQPASRFALLGVALAQDALGQVRVAITGLGNGVQRYAAAETALSQTFAVSSLTTLKFDHTLANTDLHASAEYRAHLVDVLLRRLVLSLTSKETT